MADKEGVYNHYARVRQTMSRCGSCVATTEELASHMRRASMPTIVLPNGFDHKSSPAPALPPQPPLHWFGRSARRIGYAGGSRTHQRDFALCAAGVAEILPDPPQLPPGRFSFG